MEDMLALVDVVPDVELLAIGGFAGLSVDVDDAAVAGRRVVVDGAGTLALFSAMVDFRGEAVEVDGTSEALLLAVVLTTGRFFSSLELIDGVVL